MIEWHRILKKVLRNGERRNDRTGVGTLALFGEQLVFDNSLEFPAVTTKRLAFGQVCAELACFLRGFETLEEFHRMGCTIWDGNGNAEYWKPNQRFEGDLGRIYGAQWRKWRSVGQRPALASGMMDTWVAHTDQLKKLVEGMLKEPHGRRHLVTAYNPGELDQMCLPPCHVLFQAYVRKPRSIAHTYASQDVVDLRVDMRSVDLFLGLPFDVASYAILQRLLARELGLGSGSLIFQLGDAHIYLNHLEAVNTVLSREPRDPPKLILAQDPGLFNFLPEYASLIGYSPHPAVSAALNV